MSADGWRLRETAVALQLWGCFDLAVGHSPGSPLVDSPGRSSSLGSGRLSQQRPRPWPCAWSPSRWELAGMEGVVGSLPQDSPLGFAGERQRDVVQR